MNRRIVFRTRREPDPALAEEEKCFSVVTGRRRVIAIHGCRRRIAEPAARDLFWSAERFKQLPAYLQVWPAHGAGSAYGKGLGAIPTSTVDYEKLFNPALQFSDEDAFVEYILSDQPPAPKYFALMKRVNKEGPEVLGDAGLPQQLDVDSYENAAPQVLADRISSGDVALIDVRSDAEWNAGHIAQAEHRFLGRLPENLADIRDNKPLVSYAGRECTTCSCSEKLTCISS